MSQSTDIQGLQEIIGRGFGDYHEIVSDEKSINCQARWPLLAKTQSTLSGAAAVIPQAMQGRTQIHTQTIAPSLATAPGIHAADILSAPIRQEIITPAVLIEPRPATLVKLAIAAGSRFAVKRRKQAALAPFQSVKTSSAAAAIQLMNSAKAMTNPALPVLTQVFVRPALRSVRAISGSNSPGVHVEANELTALFTRLEAPEPTSFVFSR